MENQKQKKIFGKEYVKSRPKEEEVAPVCQFLAKRLRKFRHLLKIRSVRISLEQVAKKLYCDVVPNSTEQDSKNVLQCDALIPGKS